MGRSLSLNNRYQHRAKKGGFSWSKKEIRRPTTLHVIFTYYNSPQEHIENLKIPIALEKLTDINLLSSIFQHLPTKALAELLKISCAIVADNFEDLPRFIQANNGKFFFNVENVFDAETVRHTLLKLETLKKRLNSK